jgi:hypothetical protein
MSLYFSQVALSCPCQGAKAFELFTTFSDDILPVVCGLGKYGILAHFLMADLTSFYGIRESTDRLLSSEQNSQINKLPVGADGSCRFVLCVLAWPVAYEQLLDGGKGEH